MSGGCAKHVPFCMRCFLCLFMCACVCVLWTIPTWGRPAWRAVQVVSAWLSLLCLPIWLVGCLGLFLLVLLCWSLCGGGRASLGRARAACWSVCCRGRRSLFRCCWVEGVVGLCMWSVGEGGGLVARVWEMAGCGLGGRVAFCVVVCFCVVGLRCEAREA